MFIATQLCCVGMRYESWNETFTASIASYHDGDTTKVLPIATPPGTEARAALFVIYFYLASLPRPSATSHTMVLHDVFFKVLQIGVVQHARTMILFVLQINQPIIRQQVVGEGERALCASPCLDPEMVPMIRMVPLFKRITLPLSKGSMLLLSGSQKSSCCCCCCQEGCCCYCY